MNIGKWLNGTRRLDDKEEVKSVVDKGLETQSERLGIKCLAAVVDVKDMEDAMWSSDEEDGIVGLVVKKGCVLFFSTRGNSLLQG